MSDGANLKTSQQDGFGFDPLAGGLSVWSSRVREGSPPPTVQKCVFEGNWKL